MELHEAFAEKLGEKLSIILVICAVAVLLVFFLHRLFSGERIQSFIESAGPWGPVVLIALLVIGLLTFTIPFTFGVIIAGTLYGALLGGVYAFIGSILAATIAFFFARYFRNHAGRLLGEHSETLVRFQKRHVASVVFIGRLLPVFSFEVISYGAGLTSISYTAYIIATAIGIILPIAVYTHGGALLNTSAWVSALLAVLMIVLIFVIPLAIDHYNPWGWKQKLLAKHSKKKKKAH
jgi:uncharacterized membrane protein YdjX (TVP38/TMEM64 family)